MKKNILILGCLLMSAMLSGCATFEGTLAEARAGNANAQYAVGRAYFDGDGFEKDEENAAEWFEKSAKQGNWDALCQTVLPSLRNKDVSQCQNIIDAYRSMYSSKYCDYFDSATKLVELSPDYVQALVNNNLIDKAEAYAANVLCLAWTFSGINPFWSSHGKALFREYSGSTNFYTKVIERLNYSEQGGTLDPILNKYKVEIETCITDARKAERKAESDKACLSLAKEKAEQEAQGAKAEAEQKIKEEALDKAYRENSPAFKFPKSDVFKPGIYVYKDLVAGTGYEWIFRYFVDKRLGRCELIDDISGDYVNGKAIFLREGSRSVGLRLVGDSVDDLNPVLFGAVIQFLNPDIEVGEIMAKFKAEFGDTEIKKNREDTKLKDFFVPINIFEYTLGQTTVHTYTFLFEYDSVRIKITDVKVSMTYSVEGFETKILASVDENGNITSNAEAYRSLNISLAEEEIIRNAITTSLETVSNGGRKIGVSILDKKIEQTILKRKEAIDVATAKKAAEVRQKKTEAALDF